MLPIGICANNPVQLTYYVSILKKILLIEDYPAYVLCQTSDIRDYMVQIQQALSSPTSTISSSAPGGFHLIDYDPSDPKLYQYLQDIQYSTLLSRYYPNTPASKDIRVSPNHIPASITLSQWIRMHDRNAFILLLTHKQSMASLAIQSHAEISDLILLHRGNYPGIHIHQDLIEALARRTLYEESTLFTFTCDYETCQIPSSSILYIEAHSRKLHMATLLHSYVFNGTLTKCKEQLPDYFLYAHRAYLINTRLVLYTDTSHGRISFVGGDQCPASLMGIKNVQNYIENHPFPCYTTKRQ